MNQVWLSCLLILSSVLLCNILLYGIKKRKSAGIIYFCALLIAMMIHCLGYAFELLGKNQTELYYCIQFEYLGVSFYPVFVLLFAREYADEKKFANKFIITLILTINLVTFFLVNTNSYHGLYYSFVGVNQYYDFYILALEKGVWYYVQVISLYFSIIYSVIVFSLKMKRTRGNYRKQVALMIIGIMIPIATSIIYIAGLGPIYIDLTPFSYFFMSLFLAAGLLKYDILFLAPVTYEMIFHSIEEAVLVIDKEDSLINFNQMAKKFFPSLSRMKIGVSIRLVHELEDYDFEENEFISEIRGRILNIKILDMRGNKVKVLVINDITESQRVKKQLEILATEDALTGLYNRRHFMEIIEKSTSKSTLVILDIDHFKLVNDTYGHAEGDNVLSYFGKEIKTYFNSFVTCRYGGEEFAVFLEGVSIEDAYKRVEVLRKKIANDEREIKITFSAGLAECNQDDIPEALIMADKKLYEAKESGRNQSCR